MTRSLAGETVGVLGLARSGLAAARLALAKGARVYASDLGTSPATEAAAEQVRALGGDADAGRHDAAKLAACDRIVLSPGIPRTVPILRDPAVASVRVESEVEFAFGLLDSPVIAITGTNGKTTTTALLSHLLMTAGQDAPAGGNIGIALSELAMRDPAPDVAVVEVSSFQLADTHRFAPQIGILTNLAPDHLDRYPGVAEYYADKARLFANATADSRWVLNGEDETARGLPGGADGWRFYFRVASPLEPGELGGYVTDDRWLVLRMDDGAEEEHLASTDELRILGTHNAANALAAAIAARLAGADAASIGRGLRSFEPPAHRLQPVADRDGVLWINDSKATNLASTQVALRSTHRPVVLLLGGRHKGEPYTGLLDDLRGRVRTVLAYGEAAPIIQADLSAEVPVERVDGGFDAVVRRAAEIARTGDVVLLSPACSSYDMFRDYEERGRRFAELAGAA
ncbi:MAG: murD [Gemmatimonadetes bacterium]|nr:murD [Gemmatimonadota bacterium]